jgi:CDP-diacylglycerol--inositol 3-phosphatidyltransferase
MSNPTLAGVMYVLGFAGDAVDGWVARKCDQSSKFGAVLDMITDRCATAGFLMVLSHLYPRYLNVWVSLMILDIASHWFHVTSVALQGHKSDTVLEARNPILRMYYKMYYLFGYCCVGAEMFYVFLYIYYWTNNYKIWCMAVYICLPGCAIKQIVNVVQLCSACYAIAIEDAKSRNTSPLAVAAAAALAPGLAKVATKVESDAHVSAPARKSRSKSATRKRK